MSVHKVEVNATFPRQPPLSLIRRAQRVYLPLAVRLPDKNREIKIRNNERVRQLVSRGVRLAAGSHAAS